MNKIIQTCTVHRAETLAIDYYQTDLDTDRVVVTFTYYNDPGATPLDGPGYRGEMLLEQGFNVVAFKSSANDWFQLVEDTHLAMIAGILKKYDVRCGYGSSMGGFAAIVFAKALSLTRVLALSPQFEIDEDWDRRWKAEAEKVAFRHRITPENRGDGCQYIVLFDPCEADGGHAKRISDAIGSDVVDLVPLPHSGHPTTVFLHETQCLKSSTIEALKTGKTEQFRRMSRPGRWQSKSYCWNLARHLAMRRHYSAAFKMFEIAKVLDPENQRIQFEIDHFTRMRELYENALRAIVEEKLQQSIAEISDFKSRNFAARTFANVTSIISGIVSRILGRASAVS